MKQIRDWIKEYQILLIGITLSIAIFFLGRLIYQNRSTQEHQVDTVTVLSSVSEDSSTTTEETNSSSTSTEEGLVTVDVKGAVKHPGVYELPSDARVKDAVQMAGGLTDVGDANSVNLAKRLVDEEVIYVATTWESAPVVTTGGSTDTGGESAKDKVNLNQASLSDLQNLPGIGAKRAQDIIDFRESSGPFKSVDDLGNVSGIGQKTLERLKESVTVD